MMVGEEGGRGKPHFFFVRETWIFCRGRNESVQSNPNPIEEPNGGL